LQISGVSTGYAQAPDVIIQSGTLTGCPILLHFYKDDFLDSDFGAGTSALLRLTRGRAGSIIFSPPPSSLLRALFLLRVAT